KGQKDRGASIITSFCLFCPFLPFLLPLQTRLTEGMSTYSFSGLGQSQPCSSYRAYPMLQRIY
ncbi:MAG: hypothetical protein J2P31_07900, partial [Blastocatellia bacterium]|nr:hypothetical protein [Blastocatellia bacterium]